MPYNTLIATSELATQLDNPNWAIIDCRFSFDDTELGNQEYLQAHIPSAQYAHLDNHLSAPIIPGKTGRHPLPAVEDLTERLSDWGIDDDVQVVAYDDFGGGFAARLWWLLRWLGHQRVAVLDGGWSAWVAAGLPTSNAVEARPKRQFVPRLRPDMALTTHQVLAMRSSPDFRLVDSRAPERFRGEVEPRDPVAGHIPGAINLPFAGNLDPDSHFLSREVLRARFQAALGEAPAHKTAFYCGSGVTAAHNVLAYLHAGLGETPLYTGSWSEWITDPARPVQKSI